MHGNGHGQIPQPQKGLIPFTFKDTGETVFLKKISPLLINEVRKASPPPKPPKNEVDYGDGKKVWEENASDPDYQAALKAYELEVQERILKLVIRRGVLVEMNEERMARVEELRAEMREDLGMELDSDPKYVFVAYCAVGSGEDLQELAESVFRRSQPTEGAIQEAVETFRSPV